MPTVPQYCAPGILHQQAGPRAPAIYRFGSPVPAVALYCSPETHTWQAPELPLPTGLVPPCLQQLPWLLVAHAPTHVDPRDSSALWAPDNSSPLTLLPHRHPQLATQCQEPTATHASEPQAHTICCSAGTRRLPSPQSMEAQHQPPSPPM
jgi:hypothetical protein